jgi:ribonuclease III
VFDQLEDRLGYRFSDRAWLERAMTHASFGDGRRDVGNNERLEFLGDRVLGLLTADYVYHEFEQVDEGGLASRLNAIVRKETCARVARRAGLGAALRMSPAEERSGGREKTNVLGDACEALIGALYLDGGIAAAKVFFDRYFQEERSATAKKLKDAKTRVQEWALARGLGIPAYQEVSRTGPDHRPLFTIALDLPGFENAVGEGASKQEAERAAAQAFLARQNL